MSTPLRKLYIAVALMLVSAAAQAVDPFLDWQTLESPHFLVHFDARHRDYAQHAVNIAEAVHKRLTTELQWTPAEKTHLVLSDESDFANGFATVIHISRSVLFFAPPSGVGGLEDFDNWLELLITHEYTHILHLDRAEGTPAVLRAVLGRFLLAFPNNFQPYWLIEGLATWKETDARRGIGRGQSTLFNSVMRMEVASGVKPVEQINLPISTWPGGMSRYLYGVYFFEFISATQTPEKVQALIREYSLNLIPFSINSTFRRVFGKDVSQLWADYRRWLQQRFGAQLQKLEQQGRVAGERLSRSGYRTGGVRVNNGALYYIEDNGAQQATLVRLHQGEKQALAEVVRAGFDVAANGDVVISSTEVCDEYNLYKDLYVYRAASRRLQRITECGRYVRAVWNPPDNTILALRHEAARYSLWQLDAQGEVLRQRIVFDADTVPGWYDVSADGRRMVFSLWRADSGWNLYLYDVLKAQWRALTRDSRIQAYPEFTPDGQAIVYSGETELAFNLFRYDLASGEHLQLTRTVGGAYQAVSDGEAIYYTGYSAEGSDIYRLPLEQALQQPVAGSDSAVPGRKQFAQVEATLSDYAPWQSLRPRWWFPLLAISEDTTELGLTTAGNDALGIHNYAASASYDFSNRLAALSAGYAFSNRFSLALSRDNRRFMTTTGQLNRIRSQDSLQLVAAWPRTRVLSASSLLLALSWQNDSDSRLFNGATPIPGFADNLLGVAWLFNNSRVYPLSISRNHGREVRLVAEDGGTLGGDLSGQVVTASWREYIGLGGEHVLALRALQGWGRGLTAPFNLGGEDTGLAYDILLQASTPGLFARRDYALRGYAAGLPQLRGQRARIVSAEWRFPGQRIERGIMAPPLGIMQWSGALFAETGAAYNGSRPDSYYSSAGLELSADLNLFYLVPLRARLGVARGFDDAIGETRVYLSLGSSF